MVKIAGFGNILLDYAAILEDDEILIKHKLQANGVKETSNEEMLEILADVQKKYNLTISPGGSVQNTIRIFQWLIQQCKATIMFGSIGNDDNGKKLHELGNRFGMITSFNIEEMHSGWSLCLINNENRSLVANIGASEHFTQSHYEENRHLLVDVDLVYMEGYFLTNRSNLAKTILHDCQSAARLFAFNLSAPYICDMYKDDVMLFAEQCDILFGNYDEFNALAKSIEMTTPEQLVAHLAYMSCKKIVVMTNASKNVYCVYDKATAINYQVKQLDKSKVIDTTGAGDGFAAGFLYSYLINKGSMHRNIECGCLIASVIIGQIGTSPPNDSPQNYLKVN